MPGGRPRIPGTAEERAQRQRERIKRNVRLHRQRRREAKLCETELVNGNVDIALPSNESLNVQNRNLIEQDLDSTGRLTQPKRKTSNLYLEWLSHHLPFRLCFGPSYTDAFFASSPNATSTGPSATAKAWLPLDITCGSWLQHLYSDSSADIVKIQMTEEMLLSTALRKIKDLRIEPEFKTDMLEAHTVTVERVGHLVSCQLNGNQKLGSFSLAGTIMAFAVAELIVHSSWDRFRFHIHGAGAIFEAMGPAGLDSISARTYFHGFRAMALPFALMSRRADFVCKSEWLGLHPHGTKDDYKFRISTFMDVVYQIPPIMEEYDSANPRNRALALDQLRRVLNIRTALTKWKDAVCPDDPWQSMSLPTEHRWNGISTFPTDCTANLLIAYCGASIVVNGLCADIAMRVSGCQDRPLPELAAEFAMEMRSWIEKTCWSLQLLTEAFPQHVGKMNCLFSLRASWEACTKLAAWKADVRAIADWCRRLGSHFQTNGFPLFPRSVVQFE